ncbi:MAG: hypothetical protein ACI8PT_004628 [Gammaproteobacteria bacterium]|jgi:hypothetical protein
MPTARCEKLGKRRFDCDVRQWDHIATGFNELRAQTRPCVVTFGCSEVPHLLRAMHDDSHLKQVIPWVRADVGRTPLPNDY